MLLGDIDLNGSLNAQIIHQFTERIRGKAVIQVKGQEIFRLEHYCKSTLYTIKNFRTILVGLGVLTQSGSNTVP